jgi:hypothetical protein
MDGGFRGATKDKRYRGWVAVSELDFAGKRRKGRDLMQGQVFYVDLIQILKLWNIDG